MEEKLENVQPEVEVVETPETEVVAEEEIVEEPVIIDGVEVDFNEQSTYPTKKGLAVVAVVILAVLYFATICFLSAYAYFS